MANNADFTPDKAPYVKVGSFRFWAQKVLPTVYDDSLSYYEVLTKLVWNVNKMIEDMDNFNQTTDNLLEAYNQLQDYVNHYFDNLDVQTEINNKLDEMASSGELSRLLSPYIPALVTAWLNENVNPVGSAVVVDESLSIKGAAADAQKTGILKYDLYKYNSTINSEESLIYPSSITRNGITFSTKRLDSVGLIYVHMSGTATSQVELNLVTGSETEHPDFIIPDATQYYDLNLPSGCYVKVWFRIPDGLGESHELHSSGYLRTPFNVTGFYFRLYIPNGLSVDDNLHIRVLSSIPQNLLADQVFDDHEILHDFNAYDIGKDVLVYPHKTASGITYTPNETNDGVYIVGTSTADEYTNVLVGGENVIPDGFEKGENFYVKVDNSTGSSAVRVVLTLYRENAPSLRLEIADEQEVYIPDNLTGLYAQLFVPNGVTVNGLWKLHIINAIPNDKILSSIKNADDRFVPYNAYDIMPDLAVYPSTTRYGITYTNINNYTEGRAVGTATQEDFLSLLVGGVDVVPEGFVGGRKYYAIFENHTGSNKLHVIVNVYSASTGRNRIEVNTEKEIWLPADLVGIVIQLQVESGAVVNGNYKVHIINGVPDYASGTGGGEPISVTNIYNTDQYNNTYNVTATPEISSVSNFVLESTNDETDRTNDIVTLLTENHVCRLGTGVFYISGIEMPDFSALIGSGSDTIVRLKESVTSGYALKARTNNVIQNMEIQGLATRASVLAQTEEGTRHGIMFQGTYNGTSATWVPSRLLVSNIIITGFTGGAITGTWSGSGRTSIMNVCNVHIQDCYAGINLTARSEYHKFTNVTCVFCKYGCINNGGNNIFVNCSFSENTVGFLIDNQYEQSWNNSHGSAIGCTFNHEGSNAGVGIKILNCSNGFVFNGCQCFFGSIVLDKAKGVTFTGCNFGNQTITITGATTALFNGCNFGTVPTISVQNPATTRFVNCYNITDGSLVGM